MSAPTRPVVVLATVVTVQFMVSLDLSVMNVALPAIQADFAMSPTALQWVVNAYTLVFGGFLLLGGRLGDLLGRRTVLLAGLTVFGLASLAGGLAIGPGMLLTSRAVQGLGAAVLSPVSLALVAVTFPEGPERSRALGFWAASTVLGGAIGVLASGLLTGFADWRWVLLINVPIAAVAVVTTLTGVRAPAASATPRLDVPGAVLVTAGISVLILGVVRTDQYPWTSGTTLGTLALAVLLLVAFALVERRSAQPLMRLSLLGNRGVAGANVFGFMITAGQLASFYFVSLHMQEVLGYPPAVTGVAFLPFCLGAVGGMWAATRSMGTLGPRTVLVVGGLVGAAGIAWYGLAGPGGSFVAELLGPALVGSVGIGASFVAMGAAATSGVRPEESGMASGLLNSSRQLGGSVGLAVLTLLAATVTAGGRSPSALSDGYSVALLTAGALIAIGSLAAAVLVPGPVPVASRG